MILMFVVIVYTVPHHNNITTTIHSYRTNQTKFLLDANNKSKTDVFGKLTRQSLRGIQDTTPKLNDIYLAIRK